jgi:hypothetical protein
MPESGGHEVVVQRGNIYMTHETCACYFRDIHSVALVRRDNHILLMPLVRDSGGGLLLKVRNRQGDRVVHAQEFLRGLGLIEDFAEHHVSVSWRPELAGLELLNLPLPDARSAMAPDGC